MYKIVDKKVLNSTVTRMDIEAPLVARKAQPGQFIIRRVDENGERIPLTVADYDREKGTEYLATLRTYLDCNQNIGLTAQRLCVHKNTVF